MTPGFMCVRMKAAVLLLVTFWLNAEAMEVTSSGPQTIQKAQGESVTLRCTYTPGPQDIGELDIEWSNVSPDMTQKDVLFLSYTGGQTHYYDYINPSFTKRLKFTSDPKMGDASIAVSNLVAQDTATYQCKVKKAPGVDMRKVTLVVMVKPSVPKCWVEGGEDKGSTVSLRCKSYQGSTPMTYVWTRDGGNAMPQTATQDPQSGELSIRNHSDSNVGFYTCEVRNAVGRAQCKYSLRALNPTDRVGMIVGAVIGALLLLLLLLLLIWLLVCCCRKRRYQKEVANEIREDAQAPESRPSSRQSSLRSVMGYRTHHGVEYSAVRSPMSSVRENGNSPIRTAGSHSRHSYDPKYGYPV